jgi:outer membrane immunogenic protein
MKRVVLALACAAVGLGSAGVASAADLPVKIRAPAAVVAFNWTGCFIGASGGGLFAHKEWVTNAADPTGFDPGTPFGQQDPSGWLIGGQIGCDYQPSGSNWVVGAQGDLFYVRASDATSDFVNNDNFITTGFLDKSEVRALGSATARIGYTFDRLLMYVRGGIAWERDRYTIIDPDGVVAGQTSQNRYGWTAGVGGEYAFGDNWSAFFALDYYDFGTRATTFIGTEASAFTVTGDVFDVADISERKTTVKVGLNWRFSSMALVK